MRPLSQKTQGSYLIFLQYLASYLAVLFIPLLFGSLSTLQTARNLEREALEDELRLFQERAGLLDQRLSEVNGYIAQIAANPRLSRMLDIESPYKDGTVIPELLEYRASLAPYRSLSSFVADVAVYLRKSAVVVNPDTSYISMPRFYGTFFQYGGHDSVWWFNLLYGTFHRTTVLPVEEVVLGSQGRARRMVTILQSFPLEASRQRGVIAIFIPDQELQKNLQTFCQPGGSAFILDAQGRIITATEPETDEATRAALASLLTPGSRNVRIAGRTTLGFSSASANYGWRYVTLAPTESVLGRFSAMLRTAWMILLAGLLVGVAGALAIASRERKPLASMMDMLGGMPQSKGTQWIRAISGGHLEPVQQGLRRLVLEDERLQRSVEERMPLMRSVFVGELLRGDYSRLEDVEEHAAQLGLPGLTGPLIVTAVRIRLPGAPADGPRVPRLNLAKAALRQLLEAMPGHRGYIHDPSMEETAILLEWDDGRQSVVALGTFAERMQELFASEGAGSVSIGVGEPVEGLLEARRGYQTALSARDYKGRRTGQAMVWQRDIPRESETALTTEMGTRLLQCTRTGDATGAEAILAAAFGGPLSDRPLSLSAMEGLERGVRAVMHTLVAEPGAGPAETNGYRQSLADFDAAVTVDGMHSAARSFFRSVCDTAEGRKRSHNVRLRDAILAYITEQYCDFQLYLTTVADRFGISKEYLSRFFKEQTGANFSVYVEELRIRRACELLKASPTPIGDIALQCGYSGIHAFRKAFKRAHGMAPSDYRDRYAGS